MDSLIDKFQNLQALIGHEVTKHDGWLEVNGTKTKTVHSNGYSISIGKWTKIQEWPWHTHEGYEILVCPKGSFVIDLQCKCKDSHARFILNEGGSIFIPAKRPHKVVNTIEEAELIAICMPPEILYKELFKKP